MLKYGFLNKFLNHICNKYNGTNLNYAGCGCWWKMVHTGRVNIRVKSPHGTMHCSVDGALCLFLFGLVELGHSDVLQLLKLS